jgi:hypothetical protein
LPLKLLTLLLLAALSIAASAQDLVYGNRPRAMLQSSHGPVAILEYTGGIGFRSTSDPFSSGFNGFNILGGYQLHRSFIVAAGTGIEVYKGGKKLIPVLIDMRYAFHFDWITPYLFGTGGMLFDLSNGSDARIYLNPGAGARYAITKELALNLALGLMLQSSSEKMDGFFTWKTGFMYKF